MNRAYLLLGSNAGDRLQLLAAAIRLLEENCGRVETQSAIYETAAWGLEQQPDFLNMVVLITTLLSPIQLLAATQQIEDKLGRQRDVKWGQRTLDIDILLYNNDIVSLPHLKIPHPFLDKRRFTLAPLAEIAAGAIHPVYGKTVAELLRNCEDPLEVAKTILQLPQTEK